MSSSQSLDDLVQSIYSLDREHCIHELRSLPRLRLDFSDEFLGGMSLDRLRHVLMAACVQARKRQPRQ